MGHTVCFSLGLFPELVEAVKELGWKLNILSPLNCGAFTMLSSLIICPLVSLFTMKKGSKTEICAEEAFKCYDAE